MLYISCLLGSISAYGDSDVSVTRAAIDAGSGGFKVTVADVDPVANRILKIHHSEEVYVPLRRDLHLSGTNRFSDHVQEVAMQALTTFQEKLAKYQAVEWSGIATAAARQAENAQALFDRMQVELGANIRIVEQAEEGRLGFETAVAVSDKDRRNLVSYDSGSGSFQIVTEFDGEPEILEGKFGYLGALSALVEGLRGKKIDAESSPNPVTREEAQAMVKILKPQVPQVSERFAQKLRNKDTAVVGIGNRCFIFAIGSIGTGKSTYSKDELWHAIEQHCGKSDDELEHFARPKEVVVGMVLLYSVMDALGIDRITYAYANGSCEGILIDPAYWENVTPALATGTGEGI